MPANLTPEYMAAEKAFREASSDDERLRALEEMLRAIPKHKGTDKMQADLKKRIARMRQAKEKKAAKKGFSYRVPPEGSGQVALVGPPNAGKSKLLDVLTNAEPEVAPYPFTTAMPAPGMLEYKDIQIQLVDLPPFSPDHTESWLPELVRAADVVVLLVDLKGFPMQAIDFITERLERIKIYMKKEIEPGLDFNICQKRTILVCNKLDLPQAPEDFEVLKEFYGDQFRMMAVSLEDKTNLDQLKEEIFRLLRIIRIYPKEPGKDPDMSTPFTIPQGGSLVDFAKEVHKDFVDLEYARVWGPSGKFDGQTINKDHILEDGDVVELHL